MANAPGTGGTGGGAVNLQALINALASAQAQGPPSGGAPQVVPLGGPPPAMQPGGGDPVAGAYGNPQPQQSVPQLTPDRVAQAYHNALAQLNGTRKRRARPNRARGY